MASERAAHRRDRPLRHLWIARTVRDQDAVVLNGVVRREEIVVPGHGDDAHISGGQRVRDITLCAAIEQGYRDIAVALLRDALCGDARHYVLSIGILKGDVASEYDLPRHRAARAYVARELTRILDFERGHPLLPQPVSQCHRALRVRGR